MATKKRKYNEDYIQFGFTCITIAGVDKPQCVICNKVLGTDSMRPNKLRTHLVNVHGSYANKDKEYFQRMERALVSSRLDSTGQFQKQTEAAVTASYEVSLLIAREKKPHTIGESLIKPCVDIIVKRIIGNDQVSKVNQVSLSNNTV